MSRSRGRARPHCALAWALSGMLVAAWSMAATAQPVAPNAGDAGAGEEPATVVFSEIPTAGKRAPVTARRLQTLGRVLDQSDHGVQTGLLRHSRRDPLDRPEAPAPSVSGRQAKALGDLARNFIGIDDTGWDQPDTSLAVGSAQVMEATNSHYVIFDKQGSTLEGPVTYASFFAPVLPAGWDGILTRPSVVYHSATDQYLTLVTGKDFVDREAYFFIGVSQTGDPTGTWWVWRFVANNTGGAGADADAYPDSANFGVDQWGIYVTTNLFTWDADSFKYAVLHSFNPDMLTGGSSNSWRFWNLQWTNGDKSFGLMPAHPLSVAGGQETFFVNNYSGFGSAVNLWTLTGDRTNCPTLAKATITVDPYNSIGNNVDQPGSVTDLYGGDARINSAFYAQREVWLAFTTDVFDDGSRSGMYIVRLNVDTKSVIADRLYHSVGVYYFFPAIVLGGSGLNPNVSIFVNWVSADLGQFASAAVLSLTPDLQTTLSFPNIKSGLGPYVNVDSGGRNRWGTRSGGAWDRFDKTTWGAVEWAKSNNQWSTVIAAVDILGAELDLQFVDAVDGTYLPGDELEIHNTTVNTGERASPSYSVDFYASTNTTISTLDTFLGFVNRASLQPGDEHDFITTVNLPASIAPGSYYIGAILRVSDNNTANNVNFDPVPVTVGALVPPTVSTNLRTDSGDPEILPGDLVQYSVSFEIGPMGNTGVRLELAVPDGLTLQAGTLTVGDGATVISGNSSLDTTVEVDYGALEANARREVRFDGVVDDPFTAAGSKLVLAGTLHADGFSPVIIERSDVVTVSGTAQVTVLMDDSVVLDNDGDGKANPSDLLLFRVRFKNTGGQTSEPLTFRMVAPEGTTPIEVTREDISLVSDARIGIDSASGRPTVEADIAGVPNAFSSELLRFVLLVGEDLTPQAISVQGEVKGSMMVLRTDSVEFNAVAEEPNFVEVGSLARLGSPDAAREAGGFGTATAASGNLLVIGEPDDNNGRGAVSIFRINSDGSRQHLRKVPAPDEYGDGARFGASVALDGDRLVVGAPGAAGVSTAKGPPKGNKVGLFSIGSDGFASLINTISQNVDSDFGAAVAMDGNTIAVGAPMDAEGEPVGSGAVLLYDFGANVSKPKDKKKPMNPLAGQQFGASLAGHNGKFAVGAPGPPGATNSGSASIYDAASGNLAMLAEGMDGDFGQSIAISGNRVAIGAPKAAGGGMAYEYDDGGNLQGSITADDQAAGWNFGQALAFDGDNLVVGAPDASTAASQQDDVTTMAPNGAVYVFNRARAQMARIGAFPAATSELLEQKGFGSSVAAASGLLVIGAPDSATGAGAAAVRVLTDVVFSSGFEN